MFTDMVGYTASSQTDESGTLIRRREQEELLLATITEYGGRKVKSTGDGILAEFESALRATQCAMEIQRRMGVRNSAPGAIPVELRVGIHLGDVEDVGGDIFGDAVNIAARVEPLAEPGGVCISQEVFAQVRNKISHPIEPLPPQELKGVQYPLTVYRISMPRTTPIDEPTPRDLSRIAVLPFANISPDPHDEYFADGLTEELITVLAQLQGTRVIARTSVTSYKGTTKSVAQIGSELGVGSILEGSVRKAGERIRVTAQLIDVATQDHAWAETFDRNLSDILEVQSEVAREVAKALKIRLRKSDEIRLEDQHQVLSESYLAYIRGRTILMDSFEERSIKEAQWQFERAVSLDPQNARAYAGLADATHLLGLFWKRESREELFRTAREFANRAIGLDANLAEAHSALGLILYDSLEWLEAEAEALRALTLNPSYSLARIWYSLLLQEEGRADEALQQMRLARDTDPQSAQIARLMLFILLALHRLDEVPGALDRLEKIEPNGPNIHASKAWLFFLSGDTPAAFKELDIAEALPTPTGPIGTSISRVEMLALSGDKPRARELLEHVKDTSAHGPVYRATALGYIGDLDECFRILNEQLDSAGIPLQEIRLDPCCEPIRRDPRFTALLKRLKMPPQYSKVP